MIRVLLAEDMRILRDTLVSVLNLEDDIKVVARPRNQDSSLLSPGPHARQDLLARTGRHAV
jgi:DNA-binding NarL/FixJ family response regulator